MDKLKSICTAGYVSKLNQQIKQIKQAGTLKWNYEQAVMKPKVVHVSQAKAQMETGEQKIVQVTVQIPLKQSLFIENRGKVVGGDLNLKSTVEHIVLERWIDQPSSEWLIKDKIDV